MTLTLTWKALGLRGVSALAFGVLTLLWPGITLWALVVVWGAYALIDGAALLAAVLRHDPATASHRGLFALQGVVGIAAGVVTFAWPEITGLALLFLIAAWAFIAGSAAIATGLRIRRAVEGEWLLIATGALAIVFAITLVVTPGAGALVITWLIGWFALLWGLMLLMAAWRLRALDTAAGGTGRVGGAAPASP